MSGRRGKFNNKRNFKRHKGNQDYSASKREYRHSEQLSEAEVGITEFLSDLEGFSGILKARFSDFQVNEIDLDGNIAKLTNTDIPKDFNAQTEKIDYKDVVNSPIEQISQKTWEEIKSLVDSTESSVVTLEADDISKEDRSKIHVCIKNIFGNKIVASTVSENNKRVMQFKKYDKASADTRVKWPEDKGEYVHFIVYKESVDTLDASLKISDCLKMHSGSFNYAGVKDKRSKSTQWFSVKKVLPWKLIIKTKPLRNIKIGNITFKDHPLKLGQLSGNKFRIALRNVEASDDLVNKSMEFVKENGFINYYGLQRFGNDKEVPTFEVGVKLLQSKWKEAVELILKPKKGDDPMLDITKAKRIYQETKDAEKASKEFDRNKNRCIESKLLQGLCKGNENDYVNALESIPRNMRLLYLHAFQSLIWNKMVSKRIQTLGLKPVVGDLVLINEGKVEEPTDTEGEEDEIKCKQEVMSLKLEDLDKYTIYDVVLPLPGYDIIYPENLKSFYEEALQEYQLNLDMEKQKVRTYTLSGAYRPIMRKLKDVTWKVLRYNDPNDNLILSDFEQLKGSPVPKNVENGKFKALVMEFLLEASSYATMVIREVLKMDTATYNHAKMNNYFENNDKKILSTNAINNANESEFKEIINESSLLSDKEKYEKFKSNIFSVIAAPKRKAEDVEVHDNKKPKAVETEESSIKMEATLI